MPEMFQAFNGRDRSEEHDETAKKILYDLKYSNRRDCADLLSSEAARRLRPEIVRWNPEVMIPVPLYPKKELQRGYNQAGVLAQKLSRYLEKVQINLPVDQDYLVRVKQTSAQKELSRERRNQNIRGAFEISYKRTGKQYQRVLLVDDIYTSGATLSECARILKKAGTAQVFFLTFSIG